MSSTTAARERVTGVLGLDLHGAAEGERLASLTTFLLLSETAQAVIWAWLPARDATRPAGWLPVAIALASIAILVAGLQPKRARAAAAAMAVLVWLRIAIYFPMAPNHTYLGALCLTAVAYVGTATREARLLLGATLGWLALTVLFASGVQKALSGLYLRGQFLAFEYWHAERMRPALDLLLGVTDRSPLLELGKPPHPGLGPLRFTGLLPLIASNLVWLGELLLPFGLFLRRTRPLVVWLCIALFFVIASGTRELTFGLLFINLLGLFAPRDLSTPTLPVSSTIFALMISVRMGWLPYVEVN